MNKQYKIINGSSQAVDEGKIFRTDPQAGTQMKRTAAMLYCCMWRKVRRSNKKRRTAPTVGITKQMAPPAKADERCCENGKKLANNQEAAFKCPSLFLFAKVL